MGCHTWFYTKRIKLSRIIKDVCFPSIYIYKKKGWVYYDALGYHDLFRGDYTDEMLFSYEECVRYIKKHRIKSVLWPELREFWERHPNGVISFG